MTAAGAPALRLSGITKRFGNVVALHAADLTVRAGTVHALLGENGAGKSTLMRVAFGLVRADAGAIERLGTRAAIRSPRDAITAGIAMVQQHFSLVPHLTVAENIALGGTGAFDLAAAVARVAALGESTGLVVDPRARVADLGVAAQQRVEILKALARSATLLILDEPTAVLAPADAAELLARLRAFANAGNAVVLITHKLREALSSADDITVLRHGATVHAMSASSASESELAEAMLGSRTPVTHVARGTPTGPEVLIAEHAGVVDARGTPRLRDATVRVRAGEIVGVGGLEGSGHRELLRVLAGRTAPSSGRVELPPAVGFVPEDRHRDAIVLDFSLTENVALANAGARRGTIPWRELERDTRLLMSEFDVVAAGPDALARTLSGGNQQRFVLGRELRAAPSAIVVENATRGLDIAATARVRDRLRDARGRGLAVVMYTSDLDELMLMADRVLICHDGRVREVPLDAATIGRALLGTVGAHE